MNDNRNRTLTIAVTAMLFLGLAAGALVGSAAAQNLDVTDVTADDTEVNVATDINVTVAETEGVDAENVQVEIEVLNETGGTEYTNSTTLGTLNASATASATANLQATSSTVGTHTVDVTVDSDNTTAFTLTGATSYEVHPDGYFATLTGGDRIFHGDDRELDSGTGTPLDEYQTTDGVDLVANPVPWDLNDGEAATFYPQGDDDNVSERIVLRTPTPERLNLYDDRGNRLSAGEAVELGTNVTIAFDYRAGFTDAGHELEFVAFEDDVDVSTELGEQVNTTGAAGYDAGWTLETDETGVFDVGTKPADNIFDSQGYDEQFDTLRSLRVVSDEAAELELAVDSAYQGERVRYEVGPASQGDHFALFISSGDLRRPGQFAEHRRAFRLDDDAVERGVVVSDGNAATPDEVIRSPSDDDELSDHGYGGWDITGVYAVLERDAQATSRIATRHLDDGDVDIELYAGVNEEDAETRQEALAGMIAGDDIDDRTLTVDQGEITIEQPPTTYVPGTQVDINGTTTEGMDDVQVFVRDRDDFEFLEEITVTDGQFEETSVVLNELGTPGSSILGLPGSYRFGVIDKEDVEVFLTEEGDTMQELVDGDIDLSSNAFNRGASTAQSIRVADPTLDASIETYNGEVYRDDGLYLSGELVGPRNFAVIATDAQGNTMYEDGSADRRTHEIDEDALPLESVTGTNLRSGTIDAIVLSPGRDGILGDGSFDYVDFDAGVGANIEATMENLEFLVTEFDQQQKTRTQVREILLANTVEAPGSDDLYVADSFRLAADARTDINAVVPTTHQNISGIHEIEHGETMVVRGTTNRNPDQTLMVVEATDGPDEGLAAFPSATTEDWGFDGVWSVEIPITEEVVADTYTIEVEDGVSTDQVEVEIVGEGEAGPREEADIDALQQEIQDLRDDIEALEGERDDLEQRIAELEEENERLENELEEARGETDDDVDDPEQPGFTVVAALLSLIAVALLAMRRSEE